MRKKIINDIVISKKTIRQIAIPREKKEAYIERENNSESKPVEFHISNNQRNVNWQRKPLNPKFVIWVIASICLLALFFGISIIFSSATVIITPKTEIVSFNNDTYIAKANSQNPNELPFEILKVTQTADEVVEATAEKEVNQKAAGIIIIYNNYSTVSQRLINNTRFEANTGKIYKISSSVIIPGYKKVDGKIVPGSIEATVYADQPGEEYNIKIADLTGDFKIPGFKGDPRYQAFYARIKGDITGGFIGKQRIVANNVRSETNDLLKNRLKEQLLKELYAVKPENYLIFNDGYSIDYSILLDTAVDNDKVKISMSGTLNGIVFNNSKLSKYIATKKITNFDGLQTELIISDNLVTVFTTKDNTDLWKNNTLEIKFNGDATIKWMYDVNNLKRDLAGKSESDLKNLLSSYQNSILSMKVLFVPVWTRYIPDNVNKIKVKEDSL